MLTSEPASLRVRDAPSQTADTAAAGNCRLHQDAVDRRPPPSADPRVIAFVGKGGGGKSTTIVNLACCARHEGWRVGIIDADPQRSIYCWNQIRKTDDIKVRACNADQIDSSVQLARRNGFDWLFIDMPHDPSQAPAAIYAADLVILPFRPSIFDSHATRAHVRFLRSVGRQYVVVINAAPPRREGIESPQVRETRDAVVLFTNRLWKGQVTQRRAIGDAAVAGCGVIETDESGPAVAEYRALWSLVVRQIAANRKRS